MTGAAVPRRALWPVLVPLVIFAALAAIFWRGLAGDPAAIPSALIGKPAPQFDLPAIAGLGVPGFATVDLKGHGVTVVNVFASWCAPCRDEHPLLTGLSQRSGFRLFGLNQRDRPENARAFLAELGQPFAAAGADANGRVSLDWGVYGVPETFVVDNAGLIRFKHIGPLTEESIAKELLPEIAKAAGPSGS